MLRIQPKDTKKLLQAACGKIPCDLAITDVKLVNVFTGEIYPATVYVYDGIIAHVEDKDLKKDLKKAKKVVYGKGQYLIPGLIDAHMHIESSMLTPRNFARVAIPHGTTTVVTDPHEIGNVYGVKGVEYMLKNSENLPMRQYIDIPSCVPSVPGLEHAGASFFAKEIRQLAKNPRVIGLAEVMDFLGVINGEKRMLDIIQAARENDLYLQGHAPFVTGRMLSAYLCGGPHTDHESRLADEAQEKMRNGMYVDARESSITKNVVELWKGVKKNRFFDTFCLCTDDREADDLLHIGHMNNTVEVAIKAGMDPVLAIKSATINTAREFHCENLGAIAPGYAADMLLIPSLKKIRPSQVYFGGVLTAKDGKLVAKIPAKSFPLEKENSVHIPHLTEKDLTIFAPKGKKSVKVNMMVYPNMELSSTTVKTKSFPVKDGKVCLTNADEKFIAVIYRHGGKSHIGLGIVQGFGTKCGALGSTVSHDSHNLTIVYDDPKEALMVAKELIKVHGGMCAVKKGKVLHTLALPLAGLMSLKTAEQLSKDSKAMKQADRALGLTNMENPLLRIVTAALPVIPEVKMSDMGLVDVATKKIIPLFAK